jgi:hypothetical protein
MDSSKRQVSSPPQSVTTYIADMLAQLAEMTEENGQGGLARNIRLAAVQAGTDETEMAQRDVRRPGP